MDAKDVRRWVAGYRAAEERQREEARRSPVPIDVAIEHALGTVALCGALHGWPPPAHVLTDRDETRTREAWARLRRRWPRHE